MKTGLFQRIGPVTRRACGRVVALELHLLFGLVDLHALQAADEIVVPVGAAVFTVGGGAQAEPLLLGDGGGDAAVFHLAEGLGGQLPGRVGGAGLPQFHGPQQAADVIGAEWRARARGDGHCRPPLDLAGVKPQRGHASKRGERG